MFDKDSDEKIAPYIDFITTGRIGNVSEDEMCEDEDDDSRDSGDFGGTLQKKIMALLSLMKVISSATVLH